MSADEPDNRIRSHEGQILRGAISKLQGEVATNREEIRKIRDEQIPGLQYEILGAIGQVLNSIEAVKVHVGMSRPKEGLAAVIPLGPMRAELPSSPKMIAEIARETADEVYDQRKTKSIAARAINSDKSRAELSRDLRNAYFALAVALASVFATAIVTYLITRAGNH